jgi:hypothetical protein
VQDLLAACSRTIRESFAARRKRRFRAIGFPARPSLQ